VNGSEELRLPPGYRLDRSDPDVWALRRPDGWVVAHFSAQGDGRATVVICSKVPDNPNTSVTNMAEYLAAEVIEERSLPTPLTWIEHYPEHEGEIGVYSLVRFSSWELTEVCLGGV
jgi:hypothetical protein